MCLACAVYFLFVRSSQESTTNMELPFFFFFFGAVLFEGGLEINLLLTVVCMRYDVRLISYCSPMHIVMSHF